MLQLVALLALRVYRCVYSFAGPLGYRAGALTLSDQVRRIIVQAEAEETVLRAAHERVIDESHKFVSPVSWLS